MGRRWRSWRRVVLRTPRVPSDLSYSMRRGASLKEGEASDGRGRSYIVGDGVNPGMRFNAKTRRHRDKRREKHGEAGGKGQDSRACRAGERRTRRKKSELRSDGPGGALSHWAQVHAGGDRWMRGYSNCGAPESMRWSAMRQSACKRAVSMASQEGR